MGGKILVPLSLDIVIIFEIVTWSKTILVQNDGNLVERFWNFALLINSILPLISKKNIE